MAQKPVRRGLFNYVDCYWWQYERRLYIFYNSLRAEVRSLWGWNTSGLWDALFVCRRAFSRNLWIYFTKSPLLGKWVSSDYWWRPRIRVKEAHDQGTLCSVLISIQAKQRFFDGKINAHFIWHNYAVFITIERFLVLIHRQLSRISNTAIHQLF